MASSNFIEKQKRLYKNLKPCLCPAVGEIVHFTSDGLHHLLYDGRRPRNHRERHYRVGLIPHLVSVITNAKRVVKTINPDNPSIVTWELLHEERVNNRKQIVKVILIKEGAGNVKFLSAMRKRYATPRTKKLGD